MSQTCHLNAKTSPRGNVRDNFVVQFESFAKDSV